MSENNQTKSNRGGKRANAGRKAGSATTKTREIADQAASDGITPLEVMLKAMRALVNLADSPAPEGTNPAEAAANSVKALVEAAAVAKDAAPYIHPRLSTIEHGGKDGGPIKFQFSRTIVDPKCPT